MLYCQHKLSLFIQLNIRTLLYRHQFLINKYANEEPTGQCFLLQKHESIFQTTVILFELLSPVTLLLQYQWKTHLRQLRYNCSKTLLHMWNKVVQMTWNLKLILKIISIWQNHGCLTVWISKMVTLNCFCKMWRILSPRTWKNNDFQY